MLIRKYLRAHDMRHIICLRKRNFLCPLETALRQSGVTVFEIYASCTSWMKEALVFSLLCFLKDASKIENAIGGSPADIQARTRREAWLQHFF